MSGTEWAARPDSRKHLLLTETADVFRDVVGEGVRHVAARVGEAVRPTTGPDPDELRAEIASIDLDRPLSDSAEALAELDDIYLRDAVYFHHPRYLAHLVPPVAIPALLGEAVLSALNSSLDTWDQSTGAMLIEQRLIRWITRRAGFGESSSGIFTSGGTQSNLQALMLARDTALARRAPTPGERWRVLPKLRVLASEQAHFSVVKSARTLGLGDSAVVRVSTDSRYRMRPDALEQAVFRCYAEGAVPIAVVATAGTTDFGAVDPLPALAEACRRHQLWLHVDAAYGGGLLVSARRERLAGIENADSVAVDFHKSYFQPVSCAALLVADEASLRHVAYYADYLNPEDSGVPNLVDKSLQTSRRADAVKLWLTLRVLGAEGIGALFDEAVDLAHATWRLLRADERFTVLAEPELSTVVFRWVGGYGMTDQECDAANQHAYSALFDSGAAMIAKTKIDRRVCLKFTLLNPNTTLQDIAAVLDLVAGHCANHLVLADAEPLLPEVS